MHAIRLCGPKGPPAPARSGSWRAVARIRSKGRVGDCPPAAVVDRGAGGASDKALSAARCGELVARSARPPQFCLGVPVCGLRPAGPPGRASGRGRRRGHRSAGAKQRHVGKRWRGPLWQMRRRANLFQLRAMPQRGGPGTEKVGSFIGRSGAAARSSSRLQVQIVAGRSPSDRLRAAHQ